MPIELVPDFTDPTRGTGGGGPAAPSSSIPPVISTSSLPNGTAGVAYAQVLSTAAFNPPVNYAISAGVLPPGLVFLPLMVEISGTPTAPGLYAFIFTVTDALGLATSVALSILIPSYPTIANSSLPNGTVGIPYDVSLLGQGGTVPYGFQIVGGGLAAGLVLASTGGITGTPTVAGTFSVDIEIYDSNLPQGTGTGTYSITIAASAISAPVITIDEMVLIAGDDGALYAIIPGQRHDENYAKQLVPFLQKWYGVPGSSAGLAELQLGGASVSAKGNGNLNVVAIDDEQRVTQLSTVNRPMTLTEVETKRDFMAKAVPHSVRYGIGFDNQGVINNPDGSTSFGPIADAWFELHVAILWVRAFFTSRKA